MTPNMAVCSGGVYLGPGKTVRCGQNRAYTHCHYLLKFCYSPSDLQVNCLKNSFKIYIKIYIKTAPTCFGAVTPSSGSALFVHAKVTVVKIAN